MWASTTLFNETVVLHLFSLPILETQKNKQLEEVKKILKPCLWFYVSISVLDITSVVEISK